LADPQQLEKHLADVRGRLVERVNAMSFQKLAAGSVALLVAEILSDEVYEPAQIDYDAATVDFHHHEGRDYITYTAPCTDSVSWAGGSYDDHRHVGVGPYPYKMRKIYQIIGSSITDRAAWQQDMEAAVAAINQLIDDHYEKLETALSQRVAERKQLADQISHQATVDGLSVEETLYVKRVEQDLAPKLTMVSLSEADKRVSAGASVSEVAAAIQDSIVKGIRRFGTSLEEATPGLPAILIAQHEEPMRELLLVGLRMQYGVAATAESYIRNGKTDILVRWRDMSVFIAELKIYKRPGTVEAAINQLFGYIPARSNHAALVMFIKGTDKSVRAEKAIFDAVQGHNLYIKPVPGKDKEFEFKHASDSLRKIRLAVINIIIDDPSGPKGTKASQGIKASA